jgi:L-fucose mutarotase
MKLLIEWRLNMMLLGIPKIISPDLMKVLMEMGHGDELVIADGNFPAASHTSRLIHCSGHGVPELLEAILTLVPLDTYSEKPVALMQVVAGDTVETPIWKRYQDIVQAKGSAEFDYVERFEFYERAKKAYAIVATGESALYANIILKKGVITD